MATIHKKLTPVDTVTESVRVNVVAGGAGGGAVTVADGADATQGAIADAAVVTDAVGTLNAHLRGLLVVLLRAFALGTPLRVDPTGSTTQPISAAALPLPSGAATAAKQPALGTAGAPSADVITIQGTGAGTAVNITGTVSVFSGAIDASQAGTWTVQPGNTQNTTPWLVTQVPTTSGGCTIYRLLSAASTNGNNIKGSAGQMYGFVITNTSASMKFVKLYNKATAPTVGTDTPVMTLAIPATSTITSNIPTGAAFSLGIGIGITGAVGDSDTTAVAANDVVVNLFYK